MKFLLEMPSISSFLYNARAQQITKSSFGICQYNLVYSEIPLFFNHNVKNVQYGMKYHLAYTSTAASRYESGQKLVLATILHGFN